MLCRDSIKRFIKWLFGSYGMEIVECSPHLLIHTSTLLTETRTQNSILNRSFNRPSGIAFSAAADLFSCYNLCIVIIGDASDNNRFSLCRGAR